MVRFLLICGLSMLPSICRAEDVAARVGELVEQLDARSLAERKEAEAAIVKLGTKALAHLPSSTRRLSVEAKDRLARIRKTLEQQQAKESIEPALVTISEKDTALGDVLNKLSAETGNRLYLAGQEKGPSVNATFDQIPFWQALDALLDQSKMTIYPFADNQGYRIEPRIGAFFPRAKRAVYSGAFRLEPISLDFRHDFRTSESGTFHLKLQTAWEPRLAPIAVGLKPKSLKAIDSAGKEIAIDRSTNASAVAVRTGTIVSDLGIVLTPSPRAASRSIASLSGNIAVLMPTSRVRFEFDALHIDRARRQQIGGVSVLLDGVRKVDELWKIDLRVEFKDAASGLESHLDWESKDLAYVVGPDGKQMPPTRREMQKDGNEVRWSYWFPATGKIADYQLVYDVPSDIVELEVPFELKDLPLP